VAVVCALAVCLPSRAAAQDGPAARAAAATITPDDIRTRINQLADDSMRGRYTPSPELEKTAQYIASEFRRFGLLPAGDSGSFLQRYWVTQARPDTAKARVVIAGGPTWRLGREAIYQFRSGLPAVPITGSAVVLAGTAQGTAEDSTLRGAVVIAVPAVNPAGIPTPQSTMQLQALLRSGAAAVLLAAPVPDSLWALMAQQQARPAPQFPWEQPAVAPLLVVRDAALAPLLAQHGLDLTALRHAADQPLTITRLAQLRITVDLAPSPVQRLSAPNVVGRLEGSDPLLKREYVVFSAHMDHVGVGRPNASGDSIYNGADDDASGTAAVIELAEAFARLNPRPKRSLLFLTVSGEERGLWGSSYFTSHPPVPVAQMVADLNLDMVGRNWKDTIVVIGRQHSDLGATLARVNAAHPELRMAAIDDLWPEERFYFRSDHYNFARRGVPILFFFNGVHQDYHQPSDEPAKIDAEKESRIAKLVFYLGLEVANSPQRPQWKPDSYREIVQPR
jgi:hypothetical protein